MFIYLKTKNKGNSVADTRRSGNENQTNRKMQTLCL